MKRSSLAVECPDLLSSWSSKNKESPYEVSAGSHKKVLWECELGHEWSATVKNRALLDSGCPYCNCRAVLKGFNDLATLRPELIEAWSDRNYPLKPTDISLFSNRKVWWRCKEGHEWYALVSSRSDGHGCPYCAGQRVWEGFNDLQTTHPKLASEWSDKNTKISPTTITAKNTSNLIPSNISLSGTETMLFNCMSRESVLKRTLIPYKEEYDYILIDCISSFFSGRV